MSEPTTTAPAEPTEAAPAEKVVKAPKQPTACACSLFLLADDKDVKDGESAPLFNTECTSTTLRVFAQGHDARLVSFLVNGEFDGLTVLKTEGTTQVRYPDASSAARTISEPLGDKAAAAIERLNKAKATKDERDKARQDAKDAKAKEKADAAEAKAKEKAEKAEAAKTAKAAKGADAAKVVPGSGEGDNSAPEGLIKIKVGRGEYDAAVSEVDNGEGGTKQVVTYTNLRGEEEVRDLDLVRVIG